MRDLLKRIWEWLGHIHLIGWLAEIFRVAFWPAASVLVTGGAGYFGGVPLMWILVAAALVLMSVSVAVVMIGLYAQQQSPLNKLTVMGAQFAVDLMPTELLVAPVNRQQRRAHGRAPVATSNLTELSPHTIVPGVSRQIAKGQVGVILRNTANFPISILLQRAETEVASLKPPRSTFPKKPSTVSPGGTFAVNDEAIDMGSMECGRLPGKVDMLIKYGRPGKETFELHLRGDIDVVMEKYGQVTQVTTSWLG